MSRAVSCRIWEVLIQSKTNLDGSSHGDSFSLSECRFELPLCHCVDGVLVEELVDGADYVNVSRSPILVHNQCQHACSLLFPLASGYGIVGVGLEYYLRWRNTRAHLGDAALPRGGSRFINLSHRRAQQ